MEETLNEAQVLEAERALERAIRMINFYYGGGIYDLMKGDLLSAFRFNLTGEGLADHLAEIYARVPAPTPSVPIPPYESARADSYKVEEPQ